MKTEYDKIKKDFGENMARLCRTLFSDLLEKEEKLDDLLSKHFDVSRDLYKDIIHSGKIVAFRYYIKGLTNTTSIKLIDVNKSVKELFEEKGYDIYECRTQEELDYFRRYYHEKEMLCSFTNGRLSDSFVFFAVKRNALQLKRDDFKSPQKEDEYGTSVLCIQFRKGDVNDISIVSRYNHARGDAIKTPNCLFDNDLDNINPGLMVAFAREYGFNVISFRKDFSLPNYVRDVNDKHHKYNHEIKGTYYCANNNIVNSGRVVIDTYKDKSRYILCDSYIIDLVVKRIFLYDERLKDSFVDEFIDITRIDVRKDKDTGTKTIEVFYHEGKQAIIIIDKDGKIIEYHNHYLTNVNSGFMWNSKYLRVLDTPNLESAGNGFLRLNECLIELHLNKLKSLGNVSLRHNKVLRIFEANSLEIIGNECFYYNDSMEVVYLPSARRIGKGFCYCNKTTKILYAFNLESVGPYFFKGNNAFEEVYIPNSIIEHIGNNKIKELMCINQNSYHRQ